MSFDTNSVCPTRNRRKKLLKAKIAVALQDELGRVPKTEEIEQVFLLARVMYKAIFLDYIINGRSRSNPGNWQSSEYNPLRHSVPAQHDRLPF
jgi:hypothetical protein